MSHHLIEYVWNKKPGAPQRERMGVLFGMRCDETDEVVVGWSKYNNGYEHRPFDRTFGLALAYNRANCDRKLYAIDDVPYRMREQFTRFVNRCKLYFRVDQVVNVVD